MPTAKRSSVRGEQTEVFNYRAQQGVFEWEGMVPDGDPSYPADNRARLLINTRIEGGAYVPRGGQKRIRSAALDSNTTCIKALIDYQLPTPRELVMIVYDHEANPQFQPGVYLRGVDPDNKTSSAKAALYNGDLYVGFSEQDNSVSLFKFNPIVSSRGSPKLDRAGFSQYELRASWPVATYLHVRAMGAFDGLLYIAIDLVAGGSEVFTWDGTTIKQELTGLTGVPDRFGAFRDSIIMGYSDTAQIEVHTIQQAAGTWTTHSSADLRFRFGASYKDVFYMTSGDNYIFSFDGTTLTKITNATMGISAGADTWGIENFNGTLYVLYEDVSDSNKGKIASYDGTTWTGVAKNLFTDFGALADNPRPMIKYRGDLYVGIFTTNGRIYFSSGTDVTGTWSNTITQHASTAGPVGDFIVW
jgi:hypothetical protein